MSPEGLAGAPSRGVLRAHALVLSAWLALGCSAAAPPPNAEYPSLVLPARTDAEASSAGAGRGTRAAAPREGALAASRRQRASAPAAPDAAPGSADDPVAGASGADGPGVSAEASGDSAGRPNAHGDLPDPPPLSERAQWTFPVRYERGAIGVGEPELVCLDRPQATARRIGRYAFELWVGRELIDRVRFDFPLLAAEEPPPGPRRPLHDTPRFAPGARVAISVRVPASERATRARIYDRATGDAIDVAWPPHGARATAGTEQPRHCPVAPARAAAGAPARAGAPAPARPSDAGM